MNEDSEVASLTARIAELEAALLFYATGVSRAARRLGYERWRMVDRGCFVDEVPVPFGTCARAVLGMETGEGGDQ